MPLPPSNLPNQSILYDRVRETTTTSGTGTVTLLGAVPGYQSFSVVGNGNYCYYVIADQSGSNWEVGIGQYTLSGTTLSRSTVLSSSNSGALVNFSTNTKDVFLGLPAAMSMSALFGGSATATVANTITETALLGNGAGAKSIPANLLTVGKTIRLTARGVISTAASPGTLNLKFKLGGTAVASTGAITPPASLSSAYWDATVDVACYTTGVSGACWIQGRLEIAQSSLTPALAGMANTAATTLDTTSAQAIDLTATWGTASGSNSIELTNATIEPIN